MDLGPLCRLVTSINFDCAPKGVAATVTRPVPDDTPIETRAIWSTPADDAQPVGVNYRRREPRRVLALPRADLPTIPSGTLIDAPETSDGEIVTWRFDEHDSAADSSYWRVTVARVRRT